MMLLQDTDINSVYTELIRNTKSKQRAGQHCIRLTSLYIKRNKVPVRTSVTLGMASSVANDVIMRMTS